MAVSHHPQHAKSSKRATQATKEADLRLVGGGGESARAPQHVAGESEHRTAPDDRALEAVVQRLRATREEPHEYYLGTE